MRAQKRTASAVSHRHARVALTFDDGPGPSTEALLDVLDTAGVRASFFVLGRNVERPPWCNGDTAHARGLVIRALGRGHVVGNHTYSHSRNPEPAAFIRDVARCDRIVRGLRRDAGLPIDAPIPFRLPYGIGLVTIPISAGAGQTVATVLDPRLAALASIGRTHVHWTSLFGDWIVRDGSAADLVRRMVAHVEQNELLGVDSVLGLHDGGMQDEFGFDRGMTVAAVRTFLREARQRGWITFVVPSDG